MYVKRSQIDHCIGEAIAFFTQQRFALHLPGCALPAGSDESHRLRCLEALALFPA